MWNILSQSKNREDLSDIDPMLLSAIVYPIAFIAMVPIARTYFRLSSLDDLKSILIISVLGAVADPLLLFYGCTCIYAHRGNHYCNDHTRRIN